MKEKLKVEIEPPEHGWTTVKLVAGENKYSLFPSDVPYDSIHGLISILSNLAGGKSGIFTVDWNDEPIEHEFVFDAKVKEINFVVRLINDVSFIEQRTEVFSYAGSVKAVVCPFWIAISEMGSKQSHEDYAKHWSNPFPINEMLELTEKIKILNWSI